MAKLNKIQHHIQPIEEAMGFSAVVNADGTLYLSGLIAIDEKGDIVAENDMVKQLERIYDILETILKGCGATLENVVSETLFSTDIDSLMAATPVRLKRYEGVAFPATTAVEISRLAYPGAVIEVQVIAQTSPSQWSPKASAHH